MMSDNSAQPTPTPTIVMIHGMWSRPQLWGHYREFFEAHGYRVITPTLRHHDVAPGQAPPEGLGTCSLLDYAADLEREIAALDAKPLIIGHSMGGLLAQILAARGLARSAVLLASAPCRGAAVASLSSSLVFAGVLSRWRVWRKPQKPSFFAMKYGILNGVEKPWQAQLYEMLIHESGRALCEIIFWYADKRRASYVNPADVDCPLLFMTGTKDHLIPPWIARNTAALYGDKAEFRALPGHAHWLLCEPGWDDVAQHCLAFFETTPQDSSFAADQPTVSLRPVSA